MIATPRQSRCISFIEDKTNHKFLGFSFEQAEDFISRYLDEAIKINEKPTDKQIKCAYAICKQKGIKHNCKTKKDYVIFINEHIGDYIR